MQQSYPGVSVRVTCGFQASVYSLYAAFFTIFKARACFFYFCFFVHQLLLLTSPRTCWRLRPWPGRVEMFWSNANPECLLGVSFHGGRGKRPWEKITGMCSSMCVCVCLVLSESYFINLWFYVSLLGIHGLKEPCRSVTPRHLNCITRSAGQHSAGYDSCLDCTIVLCSRGFAWSHFLQCLLDNWPLAARSAWIDGLIHQLISSM